MTISTRDQLDHGLSRLTLTLPSDAADRLLSYIALLSKWNRVYNLTAIREPAKIVTHHILDSLTVLPYLESGATADIGSGAGLPGIPIAIARPESRVFLVESNHKKSAFLRQAMSELKLDNIDVITERAELWHPPVPIRTVISRAFSDLSGFVEAAGHFCSADTLLLAMKGLYPDEELEHLPAGVQVLGVEQLAVPGLSASRHLVRLRRSGETQR